MSWRLSWTRIWRKRPRLQYSDSEILLTANVLLLLKIYEDMFIYFCDMLFLRSVYVFPFVEYLRRNIWASMVQKMWAKMHSIFKNMFKFGGKSRPVNRLAYQNASRIYACICFQFFAQFVSWNILCRQQIHLGELRFSNISLKHVFHIYYILQTAHPIKGVQIFNLWRSMILKFFLVMNIIYIYICISIYNTYNTYR